jgi:hypothetical protein
MTLDLIFFYVLSVERRVLLLENWSVIPTLFLKV